MKGWVDKKSIDVMRYYNTSEKRWECSIGEITFLAKLVYFSIMKLLLMSDVTSGQCI